MKLFDTLTRQLRTLEPRDGKVYRFYCCGPTVYGPAHIGNFRTFLLQDVFRRTLEMEGTATKHVRNLTDVDDKTIRNSLAEGMSLTDFTRHWKEKFHRDCEALGMLPPHLEPSAVEHIPHQVTMIADLMEKGHAYGSEDGSIYYRVSSFPTYGALSGLDRRELKAGASGAVADDEYDKDSVADFALWKGRKEEDGDNFWQSPWGDGRPGWHLECSAMAREYLGDTFDLHSGGVDLVFPHHDNEIAQSEACTGAKMADHWFHLTHLMVDGKKMSKSEGNFYTLDDLVGAGFEPVEVRYALIAAHYRQPLNFVARDGEGNESFPALTSARHALERLGKFERALRKKAGKEEPPVYDELKGGDPASFRPAFESLCDDLNTPEALGRIFSQVKEIQPSSLSSEAAGREWTGLHLVLQALGLALPEGGDPALPEAPDRVVEMAQNRMDARARKDWGEADRLRDEVASAGWTIKDTKEGFELWPRD